MKKNIKILLLNFTLLSSFIYAGSVSPILGLRFNDILASNDFLPFKILSNMPIAMTAHILYTDIDKSLPVTQSKKAYEYIKSSDLLILPSQYEGLPNILIETQVAGTPIISSNCSSGPKEILLNGKLGELFNVGDHKDLYKKILIYLKNQKMFKKKSLLAKKYLYRYDFKSNLDKYVKIFNKFII